MRSWFSELVTTGDIHALETSLISSPPGIFWHVHIEGCEMHAETHFVHLGNLDPQGLSRILALR